MCRPLRPGLRCGGARMPRLSAILRGRPPRASGGSATGFHVGRGVRHLKDGVYPQEPAPPNPLLRDLGVRPGRLRYPLRLLPRHSRPLAPRFPSLGRHSREQFMLGTERRAGQVRISVCGAPALARGKRERPSPHALPEALRTAGVRSPRWLRSAQHRGWRAQPEGPETFPEQRRATQFGLDKSSTLFHHGRRYFLSSPPSHHTGVFRRSRGHPAGRTPQGATPGPSTRARGAAGTFRQEDRP